MLLGCGGSQTSSLLASLDRALQEPDANRWEAVHHVLERAGTDAERRELLAKLSAHVAATNDGRAEEGVTASFVNGPCVWWVALGYFPNLADLGVECRPFPTKEESERRLREAALAAPTARTEAVLALLNEMRGPQNGPEADVLVYVFELLAGRVLDGGDYAMLDAVDAFRTDGGVTNDTCVFYGRILSSSDVRARYEQEPLRSQLLRRCTGIVPLPWSDPEN